MQIIRDLNELRTARAALTGRVAIVPTMGALHAGHLALVDQARRNADRVVVSLFVNPAQFAPGEDLSRYPRREEEDAAMLAAQGVDLLWMPRAEMMYPPGFATSVSVGPIGDRYEGTARPGHFSGVATVVAKLFGQVQPDVAIFGEKDWQQLAVVRRMVIDLDLSVGIVGVPTVRDEDGLALSSRNAYLSADERARAPALHAALLEAGRTIVSDGDVAAALAGVERRLSRSGFAVAVDYVDLVDENLLATDRLAPHTRLIVAARLGSTRLIDNLACA